MSKKIVVIGGVAGGASVSARLRRLSEDDKIIMFEKDEYISFANCGLPYYIGDVISDRNKLLVQTVEGMTEKFNLDIRNLQEVIEINRDKKLVKVLNKKTNETYIENYDVLVLSMGANPIVPPINGIKEAKNIHTVRNIPDIDKIKHHSKDVKKAVVVGGGFIGVEMAENLRHIGIDVTLVEKLDQVMTPFDFEMASLIHNELINNGVNLKLSTGVVGFEDEGKFVVLDNGEKIESDLTILAIGIKPNTELAKNADILLNERGYIVVDEYFKTNDENIYACGDAIETFNFITGNKQSLALAGPANRQARIIADNINGMMTKNRGVVASSVAKIFNLNVASTGLNEKIAKQLNIEYEKVHVIRGNHAGYYPNSSMITFKLIYDKNSEKVLGAQAIGQEGTEKRIDVIATAIRGNMTIDDLVDLELCYAPPFSSAKDVVNIAGYTAKNIINNMNKIVHYDEIDSVVKKGNLFIDVRTEIEFSLGHIEGSINIPQEVLRNNLDKLPADKNIPIYVTCQVGFRGYLAAQILRNNGYTNVYNLSGGYKLYSEVFSPKKVALKCNINKESLVASNESQKINANDINVIHINALGLQCPGPIMETYKTMKDLEDGQRVQVEASDFGFATDIDKWCTQTNNKLISLDTTKNKVTALIEKGDLQSECALSNNSNNATIVLFSGELDKAMAAFIIAQGAASMGMNVSIFFTFWGLNALRKNQKINVDKTPIEAMFGAMMPKGASNLGLSNMQMMGMGKAMMEKVMKDKNVDDIETLMKNALEQGVKFTACTMSMDVMGLKKEELIDGINYGGVASYVADSKNASLTLFI